MDWMLEAELRNKYKIWVYGKISCILTSCCSLIGGHFPSVPAIGKLRCFVVECLSYFESPKLCLWYKLLLVNNIGLCVWAVLVLRWRRINPVGPLRVMLLYGKRARKAFI